MSSFLSITMFTPPWWAIFLNAHFLPRRALFKAMKRYSRNLKGNVLDVGCGTQPYRHLLQHAQSVTGLELDTPENREGPKKADVYYDGNQIPFPDQTFDGLLCNQVLEHVFDPDVLLADFFRVMAPGGVLVLSTPFIWPEHEVPNDSQRFSSYGLAHKVIKAGFRIESQEKLIKGAAAQCALLADCINARLTALPLPFRVSARALLITPISMLGLLSDLLSNKEDPLYLDNFIVATRPATDYYS